MNPSLIGYDLVGQGMNGKLSKPVSGAHSTKRFHNLARGNLLVLFMLILAKMPVRYRFSSPYRIFPYRICTERMGGADLYALSPLI